MKAHNLDVFAMAMAIMWVCGEELGNPLVAVGFAGWARGSEFLDWFKAIDLWRRV